MSTIIVLMALYILNTIDYLQTIYAISVLGIKFELNPIGRLLIENDLVFAAKMILVPALLIVMGYILIKEKSIAWLAYIPFTAYLIVVIRNFIVMANHGLFNL